jgi:hypothetical protein
MGQRAHLEGRCRCPQSQRRQTFETTTEHWFCARLSSRDENHAIDELLSGMTKDNVQEVDWGPPRGKEAW